MSTASAKMAPTSLTPDEALAKLKEGNAKYMAMPRFCETDKVKITYAVHDLDTGLMQSVG